MVSHWCLPYGGHHPRRHWTTSCLRWNSAGHPGSRRALLGNRVDVPDLCPTGFSDQHGRGRMARLCPTAAASPSWRTARCASNHSPRSAAPCAAILGPGFIHSNCGIGLVLRFFSRSRFHLRVCLQYDERKPADCHPPSRFTERMVEPAFR